MSWIDFLSKLDGRQNLTRWLFTVGGASSTWDTGYQADIARWLLANTGNWRWQGIGYPATPVPEGPSVAEGVAELENQIALKLDGPNGIGEWGMVIYSEGAIVGGTVYNRMKAGISPVSWALPRLKIVVTYGNPLRELGVAHGNDVAGWPKPPPNSRGIAPASERIVDTPPWWYDFAHPHDIYTDTPDDEAGEDMTLIYDLAQNPSKHVLGLTTESLMGEVLAMLKSPLKELPGAVIAIMHGIGFLAAPGGPTWPHISYELGPGIGLLADFGARAPIPM